MASGSHNKCKASGVTFLFELAFATEVEVGASLVIKAAVNQPRVVNRRAGGRSSTTTSTLLLMPKMPPMRPVGSNRESHQASHFKFGAVSKRLTKLLQEADRSPSTYIAITWP